MAHPLRRRLDALDFDELGREIYAFAEEAYPICRSLTGDGVRRTLDLVRRIVPVDRREVPTGTQVFDWVVPREWNVREAWVEDPHGRRLVDFARHNLHLVGYSVPFRGSMPLAELRRHLHTDPERPEVIPYRTTYYREQWGFCLPHRELAGLTEGDYEVRVDATLEEGSLTYGELVLPGEGPETVLLSTHVCHPSLANDNLSGIGVCAFLARELAAVERRYTYRFLFVPGTLGAIAWLALEGRSAAAVCHGLVAANLGDRGRFHYKRSRRGDAEIDRVVAKVLADSGEPFEVEDFVPFGYDERQYCSPGFNLPVGSLTRTPWGRYPEYHSSADDLTLISGESLGGSLRRYLEVLHLLEANRCYLNTQPHGEPQLGRRGLYRSIGGDATGRERELALLWVLNLSDGDHSLLDVAERSGLHHGLVVEAAERLLEASLLRPAPSVAGDGGGG